MVVPHLDLAPRVPVPEAVAVRAPHDGAPPRARTARRSARTDGTRRGCARGRAGRRGRTRAPPPRPLRGEGRVAAEARVPPAREHAPPRWGGSRRTPRARTAAARREGAARPSSLAPPRLPSHPQPPAPAARRAARRGARAPRRHAQRQRARAPAARAPRARAPPAPRSRRGAAAARGAARAAQAAVDGGDVRAPQPVDRLAQRPSAAAPHAAVLRVGVPFLEAPARAGAADGQVAARAGEPCPRADAQMPHAGSAIREDPRGAPCLPLLLVSPYQKRAADDPQPQPPLRARGLGDSATGVRGPFLLPDLLSALRRPGTQTPSSSASTSRRRSPPRCASEGGLRRLRGALDQGDAQRSSTPGGR